MFALALALALAQDAGPILDGRYRDIRPGTAPREKAAWAFGRYHLGASKRMVEAATEAHEAGEPLGTLVLVLCHRNGVALRRDEKTMWRLNHALLSTLREKQDLTPFETYMFSHAMVADESGTLNMQSEEGKQLKAEGWHEGRQRKLRLRAAEGGCAQAMNDLGRAHQDSKEYEQAYAWYEKAAARGLAEGLRNQGYLLMVGRGVAPDPERAFGITRDGADRGDVFAMVNMAVYYEKGMGVARDPAKGRAWIEKAAKTGHWVGALEMAGGLLAGHYGFEKDAAKGKEWLKKGIETRQADVLYRVASWYMRGFILEKNARKAVEFAEAAFVQGETKAANLLSHVYKQGSAGDPKNEKLHLYWFAQSKPSLAYAVDIDSEHPALTGRLRKLDPWKVEIE